MVTFATTATGGLASTALSTIDVTFPAGTSFGSFGGGGVFDNNDNRIGNCSAPVPATPLKSTCGIFGAIGPSTNARLEFNGVTNPATAGTTNKVTVATSSDTTSVDSANYTVAPANTLSNITVANGSPSAGRRSEDAVRGHLRHDRHRRARRAPPRARSTSRSRPARRSPASAAAACSSARHGSGTARPRMPRG